MQKPHFIKTQKRLKAKRWEKIIYENLNQNITEEALLNSDKIDIIAKNITRNKKGLIRLILIGNKIPFNWVIT